MRKIINVDWEFDSELPNLDNYRNESHVRKDIVVSFEYNGYKLEALVDYLINLSTTFEKGGSDDYGNFETIVEVFATDFRLDVKIITHNDGNEFNASAKVLISIEEQLLNDLKTQY